MNSLPQIRSSNGTPQDMRRAIDELIVRAQMLQVIPGNAIEFRQTGNGVLLNVKPSVISAAAVESGLVKQFYIITIYDAYLACRPAKQDGTEDTGAAIVNVARPADLQGAQVNETIAEGVITYRELIRPAYAVGGNDVFAARSENGTGVVDSSGEDVEWIDLTPRSWRPGSFLANLCIRNEETGEEETHHAIVWGGPVYRLPSEVT